MPDRRDRGRRNHSEALSVEGHLLRHRNLGVVLEEKDNLSGIQKARSQAVKQREKSPMAQEAGSSA